jgi:prepilin-type processing-associated H-X9-DG protein
MANAEVALNPPLGIAGLPYARAFHSPHEGGSHFLFGDGAVKFLSENIDHTARCWQAGVTDTWNPNCPGTLRFDQDTAFVKPLGTFQRLAGMNDGLVVGEY